MCYLIYHATNKHKQRVKWRAQSSSVVTLCLVILAGDSEESDQPRSSNGFLSTLVIVQTDFPLRHHHHAHSRGSKTMKAKENAIVVEAGPRLQTAPSKSFVLSSPSHVTSSIEQPKPSSVHMPQSLICCVSDALQLGHVVNATRNVRVHSATFRTGGGTTERPAFQLVYGVRP